MSNSYIYEDDLQLGKLKENCLLLKLKENCLLLFAGSIPVWGSETFFRVCDKAWVANSFPLSNSFIITIQFFIISTINSIFRNAKGFCLLRCKQTLFTSVFWLLSDCPYVITVLPALGIYEIKGKITPTTIDEGLARLIFQHRSWKRKWMFEKVINLGCRKVVYFETRQRPVPKYATFKVSGWELNLKPLDL